EFKKKDEEGPKNGQQGESSGPQGTKSGQQSGDKDGQQGGTNGQQGGTNGHQGEKNQAMPEPEKPRRALPSPRSSPPVPTSEYQGFPLVGVPPSDTVYPLMKAVYGGPHGDAIKESRIKAYGWINASGNWSTSCNSNTILSYWVDPNRLVLDQAVLRF